MSRTFIEAGRRYQFTAANAHKAGDLVWAEGYYGIVQDDNAADALAVMILEGVWDVKNIYGGPFIPGTKVYAVPADAATTGRVYMNAASLPASAVAIGRVWHATVAASAATAVARVQLFNPNAY